MAQLCATQRRHQLTGRLRTHQHQLQHRGGVMRYYLANCEYKWSHAHTDMEKIWIRRELGDELYDFVEQSGWKWHLMRSNSQVLPSDIYCRCDIYIDTDDSAQATLFVLRFPKATPVHDTSTDSIPTVHR